MSEPIIIKKEKEKNNTVQDDSYSATHDFPSMIMDFFKAIPWRTSVYLFVLMIILFSQQFTEHVLYPIGGNNWVDGNQQTNIGTIVLCIITILGYILIDLLVRSSIL